MNAQKKQNNVCTMNAKTSRLPSYKAITCFQQWRARTYWLHFLRELPVWCMGRCHANHVLVAFFSYSLNYSTSMLFYLIPIFLLADMMADTRHISIHKMNKICSMLRVYPSTWRQFEYLWQLINLPIYQIWLDWLLCCRMCGA